MRDTLILLTYCGRKGQRRLRHQPTELELPYRLEADGALIETKSNLPKDFEI